MKTKPSTLGKLFEAYNKSWYDLVMRRDELFPVGTRVLIGIGTNLPGTVMDGSMYADQVMTEWGHVGWQYLQKIDQPRGE